MQYELLVRLVRVLGRAEIYALRLDLGQHDQLVRRIKLLQLLQHHRPLGPLRWRTGANEEERQKGGGGDAIAECQYEVNETYDAFIPIRPSQQILTQPSSSPSAA